MSPLPRRLPASTNLTWVIQAALALLLLAACGGGGGGSSASQEAAPTLSEALPASGLPGTSVGLVGTGLSPVVSVTFSPSVAAYFDVNAKSGTYISTTVPDGAQSGPVTVTTRSGRSATIAFTVLSATAPPALSGFDPASARAHTQVTITGSGLGRATAVTFGGSPALWFGASESRILAAVPPGAATGRIEVTTPNGTATSAQDFTFDPGTPEPPTVTDIQPVFGPVGTRVLLDGRGLLSVTQVDLPGARATFTRMDDSRLQFQVPAGATSGPVTLTSASGATAASRTFVVTSGTPAAPTFSTFAPQAGPPGQRVEITGTGLAGVTEATIGGVDADTYLRTDTTLITWVPKTGAVSGPIVLTYPGGTVTHPTPFTVAYPAPAITRIDPDHGPEGTPVWIQGTNLGPVTRILFGSTPAVSVAFNTGTQIRALVPRGAATGPVTVDGPGGSAQSAQPFTVVPGPSGANTRISGLYVTQATQTLGRTVPLAAGREGRVRVFLEVASPNLLAPSVRVTVADASGAVLVTRDIPAPRPGVPTSTDDGLDGQSWDFTLDGAFIQPGNTIRAGILAAGAADLSPADDAYPPGGGTLPLNVVAVPPIGITFIPVRQDGRTGRVSDATRPLESWVSMARRIWPFKDIDLARAPELAWSEPLRDNPMAWVRLRDAIEAQRLVTDPRSRRYHYAVIDRGPYPMLYGLADRPDTETNLKRSAVGWDGVIPNGETYFSTFAHELGHNLGRRHTDCGGAAGPDPAYPYPGGDIGSAGFDLTTGRVLQPRVFKDIMSYCTPQWVSDFVYQSVLKRRAWELASPVTHAPAQALVVWGRIRNGEITLEPAFQAPEASDPPAPGSCTLILRDASGAILQEVPFEAPETEDLPQGEHARSFAFALPLDPAVQAALASMEVLDASDANLGTLRRVSRAFASPLGLALPRDPVAQAWGPGVVHLSWDASTHPMVMVREPATGAVIGMVEGGSAEVATRAAELDLDLSAGIGSTRLRVKVTP